MRPLFTVPVWLTAAAHFAFLIYLPTGGFLALRWQLSIWLHVPVVLWAIAGVALNLWCPLTALERWARSQAGMPALSPAGFIDHYITGALYPSTAAGYVQAAVFLAVGASWTSYVLTVRRHRGSKRPTDLAS